MTVDILVLGATGQQTATFVPAIVAPGESQVSLLLPSCCHWHSIAQCVLLGLDFVVIVKYAF